jgi:hypothetical protein
MNNILKVSLIVIAVLVIAGGLFFAGSMFGSSRLMRGIARSGDLAPGRVMNQGGSENAPVPNNDQGNQPGRPGRGPGMQGGRNGGQPGWPNGRRMPGQQGGPGMRGMPGGQNRNQANLIPLTVDEATQAAQNYITSLNIDGLEVGEVLILENRAYVAVKETATGLGAFELMVNPVKKEAHPKPGVETLWNLKYGGLLEPGLYGRFGQGPTGPNLAATPDPNATPAPVATPANVSAEMPLSAEQAIEAAQKYLDINYPGATAGSAALQFYGYYSIDFSKDGNVVGKLHINGYNGQVAGHPWRADLVEQPQ